MRFEMKMPDLAATESEIRIVRWMAQPGEKVERGQMFVEVETDKAVMEVESAVSGILQEVLCQPGQTVAVGDVVAVVEVDASPGAAAHREEVTNPLAAQPVTPASGTSKPAVPIAQPAGRPAGMFAQPSGSRCGEISGGAGQGTERRPAHRRPPLAGK